MLTHGIRNRTRHLAAALLLSPLWTGCAAAPRTVATPLALPFELTSSRHIAVQALVNQEDQVRLMFHTGAGSTVSITKAAAERMASLEWEQAGTVTSWGGTTQAGSSTANSLEIGGRVWRDLLMTEVELSGGDTDGKFGPGLFEGEVLEFDFQNRMLTVHESLPVLLADFERLDLRSRQGLLFLEAEVDLGGDAVRAEFMLHSGFGGTLLLEDSFATDHALSRRLETISEGELRDSYGNVLKTREVCLPGLRLGGLRLADVPAGTFEGRVGQQRISVLGMSILSRFHMVLDVGNGHLYLKEVAV